MGGWIGQYCKSGRPGPGCWERDNGEKRLVSEGRK